MKIRWALALPAALAALMVADTTRASDIQDHIYRIRTQHEDGGKVSDKELTGFKVVQEPGLYTCLHGVVGAKSILAVMPSAKKPFSIEMRISQADVERDIAFLTPVDRDGIAKLGEGGLALGKPPRLDSFSQRIVQVYGYPINISLLASSTPLTVRDPAVASLEEVLDDPSRKPLKDRASPKLSVRVLNLAGHLLPGHSGAPILERGAVIAIGSGALHQGRVEQSWAIPFHDVELVQISDPKVRVSLAKLSSEEVDSRLMCIIDEKAREAAKTIRIQSRAFIASPDGAPVQAFDKQPGEAIKDQFDRLGQVLDAIKNNKAKDLNPQDEFNRWAKRLVPLANGTRVEVLEIGDKGGAIPGMEGLPKMEGLPNLAQLLDPVAKKGGGDLSDLAKSLGGIANQVNARVKILEGPGKGQVLWVNRSAIKQETTLVAE